MGWRCCRAGRSTIRAGRSRNSTSTRRWPAGPHIIIVDELAHTNAPDSRHPKRYQDIEELLAAGINVWSAMNIQHLESLSDVVAQITGVQVRERVPDIVLQRADEVLLVDLAPAELIERLKEGKVYLPENAQRAVDSFFRLGNLTALARDGAAPHRRPRRRPDGRLSEAERDRRALADGRAAAGLHRSRPLSEKVVRTAARLASGLNAPWLVVSIERADSPPPRPEARQRARGDVQAGGKPGRRDPPGDRAGFRRGDTARRRAASM